MKKLLVGFLLLAVLAALTACRQNPENIPSEEATQGSTTQSSTDTTVAFTPIQSGEDYFRTRTYIDERTHEDVDYLFHQPVRDTGKKYPLVIFLHGLGNEVTKTKLGTARYFVEALIYLENSSEEYSAYTLVPTTPHGNEGWWTPSQLSAFKKLIREVISNYNVDPNRVYISGISMGGMVTCQLVNEMSPNTFAAAVPLSGAYQMTSPYEHGNTAFRIYHSTNDQVVSVSQSRNLYNQLRRAGHDNVELIEFPHGDHTSPLRTVFHENYYEFFPWLFSQSLS